MSHCIVLVGGPNVLVLMVSISVEFLSFDRDVDPKAALPADRARAFYGKAEHV